MKVGLVTFFISMSFALSSGAIWGNEAGNPCNFQSKGVDPTKNPGAFQSKDGFPTGSCSIQDGLFEALDKIMEANKLKQAQSSAPEDVSGATESETAVVSAGGR